MEIDESVTRKHFIQVANTVRAIQDPEERQKFADHHAQIFSSQNPRFDHKRWHAAAGTKTREERGIHEMSEDFDPNHPSRRGKNAWVKKYSKVKEPPKNTEEDRERNRKSSENAVKGFQGEEIEDLDETKTSTKKAHAVKEYHFLKKKEGKKPKEYARMAHLKGTRMEDVEETEETEGETPNFAAALAIAALEDRPADVSDIFHDALQARVASMVEAYYAQLTQEGFGTSEDEIEEGMVCKDTGDDKGGGDDKDFGGKEKKAKKDDDSKDDDDGDDDDKGKDKDDDGDKKKPSFLKKEEEEVSEGSNDYFRKVNSKLEPKSQRGKSLADMISKGSYVPKGGSKGYVGGSGDHGK